MQLGLLSACLARTIALSYAQLGLLTYSAASWSSSIGQFPIVLS